MYEYVHLTFVIALQGMGVVLKKEGGLHAGGFVNEYLGEMFTPWAWQERQVTDSLYTRCMHD